MLADIYIVCLAMWKMFTFFWPVVVFSIGFIWWEHKQGR